MRRRLRYQLYCVQTGLGYPLDKATAPSAKRNGAQRIATVPAEKKAAEEVLTAVNKLADLIEKNKLDLIQLISPATTGARLAKLAKAARGVTSLQEVMRDLPRAMKPRSLGEIRRLLGEI